LVDLIGEGRKGKIKFLSGLGCLGITLLVALVYWFCTLLFPPKKVEYFIPPAPIAINGQHYCYTQFRRNPALWYVLDIRQQGISLRGIADIAPQGVASISGTVGKDNVIQLLMVQQVSKNTSLPIIGDLGFTVPGMGSTEIKEFSLIGKYTAFRDDMLLDGLSYAVKDGRPTGEPSSFHCSTIFPKDGWRK
jgi:hypothetical protein